MRKFLSEKGFPGSGATGLRARYGAGSPLMDLCDELSAQWPELDFRILEVCAVLDKMEKAPKAAAAPPGGGTNVGAPH